jgi:H/ACA ribonucleoprotein complex subunit 1
MVKSFTPSRGRGNFRGSRGGFRGGRGGRGGGQKRDFGPPAHVVEIGKVDKIVEGKLI